MGTVVIQDGAAIPEAVKRQAEEDDRKEQAEIAARKVAEVAKPPEEILPPEAPVPATTLPPVAPAVEPVGVGGDTNQLVQMQRDLALERQRNQTLQGRIDAIGPQSAELVRELREQNQALMKRLDTPTGPVVPPHLAHLNPEEREVYANQELPPEVRMAQGEIEASAARFRAENAALKERLDRMEQGTTTDREDGRAMLVMQEVEKICPGAMAVNKDPVFIQWLNNQDHRSINGASYGDRGYAAMERGDSYAISELINEFLATGQITDPRITAQIKPELTTATPALKQSVKETVLLSEAEAFYNDKALGRCKNPDGSPMTKEQIDSVDKRIDLAMTEGRVVQG